MKPLLVLSMLSLSATPSYVATSQTWYSQQGMALVRVLPGTPIELEANGLKLRAWQKAGAPRLYSAPEGIPVAILHNATPTVLQEQGLWRLVALQVPLQPSNLLSQVQPLWDSARRLKDQYCSSCHNAPQVQDYNRQEWPFVLGKMLRRTPLSEADGELLMQYVLWNAAGEASP